PYQAPRNEPTLLDKIRDGKEDEPSDNFNSSYYGGEVIPKNETPEQAKRRIYNRSRRMADILSLRKERIETSLEIRRARTSMPETASVQVVQAPEASREGPTQGAGRKGVWSWFGWGATLAGLALVIRPTSVPKE